MSVPKCQNINISVSKIPLELIYNPIIEGIKETEKNLMLEPCPLHLDLYQTGGNQIIEI